MASSMRKLTPKLVTVSPPPTPKDVYKLLGVSGLTPNKGCVQTVGGQWTHPKGCVQTAGGLDTHPQKCCFL